MTELVEYIAASVRILGILYVAFLSVGIYFQIPLVEPIWIVRAGEAVLGFVIIAVLWIEAYGYLVRDHA